MIVRAANGFTLTVTTETIDVTSLGPRPDPAWHYVDEHGDEHRWATEGESFTWVQLEDDYTDEDGEEYPGIGQYECRWCHEHLTPGLLGPITAREYVPGLVTATAKFSDGMTTILTTHEYELVRDQLRAGDLADAERQLRRLVDER